jgi:hypothetical protein
MSRPLRIEYPGAMNLVILPFIYYAKYEARTLTTSANSLILKHTAQSAAYYEEFRCLKNMTEKLKNE